MKIERLEFYGYKNPKNNNKVSYFISAVKNIKTDKGFDEIKNSIFVDLSHGEEIYKNKLRKKVANIEAGKIFTVGLRDVDACFEIDNNKNISLLVVLDQMPWIEGINGEEVDKDDELPF